MALDCLARVRSLCSATEVRMKGHRKLIAFGATTGALLALAIGGWGDPSAYGALSAALAAYCAGNVREHAHAAKHAP